jgi:hypothetical protein
MSSSNTDTDEKQALRLLLLGNIEALLSVRDEILDTERALQSVIFGEAGEARHLFQQLLDSNKQSSKTLSSLVDRFKAWADSTNE